MPARIIAPAEMPIDCQTLPSHKKKFLSKGLKCSCPVKSATGNVSPIDAVDLLASLAAVIAESAIRAVGNSPLVIFAAARSGMSLATRSMAAVICP